MIPNGVQITNEWNENLRSWVRVDQAGPILVGLRTTVPLVSYIRNSLRFWYYASLSTCCQNLEEKIGVTGKIWEKWGSNF